jgi:hypothetical protein
MLGDQKNMFKGVFKNRIFWIVIVISAGLQVSIVGLLLRFDYVTDDGRKQFRR